MKICKQCGRLLPDSAFSEKQAICRYCRRTKRLYQNYGITDEDYKALWIKQQGKCAICGKELQDGYLDVDHDHSTGLVRGLLCRTCNLWLDDNKITKEKLQKLEQYLENKND